MGVAAEGLATATPFDLSSLLCQGFRTASARPAMIATTRSATGSIRRRGRPSGTGSNSTLTRAADYPASGTIRPSSSIVAWRRKRFSSAPGTWSRAW